MENENVVNVQESEFGTKGITGLFFKYAGFAFLGLLAQGIMVFLEGIIIGNGLGTSGLTIVGLLMPLEYFLLALCGCFSVGISTLCAMKMGDGKEEEARRYYAQGMWLVIYAVCVIIALIEIFAPQVASFVGAPPEFVAETARCIRIFVAWWPFSTIGYVSVYMLRLDEKPKSSSFIMTLAAVGAIVWLYISTYFLHFGTAGASIYYGASIGLFGLGWLYFLFNKNTKFKMHIADMKLEGKIVGEILKIGFPYIFVQLASSIFGIIVNNMLGSDIEIAAYAVLNGYIIYILMMVMQAATQGMQPIVSYNLGARKYSRLRKTMRTAIVGNLVVIYVVAALFVLLNRQVCSVLCGADTTLIETTMRYNIMICSVCGLGFTADLLSGYFQSVEKIGIATALGLARYIIFSVPAMLLLNQMIGSDGVWWGQIVGYVLAFLFAIGFAAAENKRLVKLEKENTV